MSPGRLSGPKWLREWGQWFPPSIRLGDGEFLNNITNPAEVTQQEEVLGFVFDSKDTAEEYFKNIGVEIGPDELYPYDTSQLISPAFEDMVDAIVINGELQVPYEEFAKLELAFTIVD